jgi:hypothetical protein
MNHKSRSGNPEFEIEFTVESREISGKSEEKELQERRETSILHRARNPREQASKSPRGEKGGGSGGLEWKK